jgi:hypothetical protein
MSAEESKKKNAAAPAAAKPPPAPQRMAQPLPLIPYANQCQETIRAKVSALGQNIPLLLADRDFQQAVFLLRNYYKLYSAFTLKDGLFGYPCASQTAFASTVCEAFCFRPTNMELSTRCPACAAKMLLSPDGTLSPMQEAEFNMSIYHFFLWQSVHKANKKQGALGPFQGTALPAAAAAAAAPSPESGKNKPAASPDLQSQKYRRLMEAMKKEFPEFPQQFDKFPTELQNQPPPIITTLYATFPGLQEETVNARNLIMQQNAEIQQYGLQLAVQRVVQQATTKMSPAKRKDPPRTAAAPAVPSGKRAKVGEGGISPSMSVAARADVPEDVKQLVKLLRGNARKEKAKGKQQARHLEERVAKNKEVAGKVDKEKLDSIANTPESTKIAPEPQPTEDQEEASAEAAPSPVDASPESTPPDKKTLAHVSFEDRMKEFEHFVKGNGHARVSAAVPGLGRWVQTIRAQYRKIQEFPSLLEHARPNTHDLTQERIDRFNELGMIWDFGKVTLPWEVRYNHLVEFKKKNGHTRVPRKYKENQQLGEWVHMQRKLYKKKVSAEEWAVNLDEKFERSHSLFVMLRPR